MSGTGPNTYLLHEGVRIGSLTRLLVLMALKKTRYGMPVETAEMEAYNTCAREKLEEWGEKIHSIQSAARKHDVDGFVFYREFNRRMQRSLKTAEETIQELRSAENNTWSDIRTRMEYAWEALEDIYAHWSLPSLKQ
ncbi:MAG TPA: hypothetical protein VI873_03130 [Candidatus Peribacteraceae bacterium]|nr:hypothetical protein [Candidatus Peribacteraceae bacterium]